MARKRKKNARSGKGTITIPFEWDTTPDERDFSTKEFGEAAARVLEGYTGSSEFYDKMSAELGTPVRKKNPGTSESELTKRLKF